MISQHFLPRELPAGLESLTDLAFDLSTSTTDSAIALWRAMDADLWEATENPVLIVESISRARLQSLATDDTFMRTLRAAVQVRKSRLEAPTWLANSQDWNKLERIAYFSMEFGIEEALPIYSGGLGMLAGDHLRTANDLGLPLVAVGLLYQQGYFRQSVDRQGEQLAFFPFNDPLWLPVTPVRDADGEWLCIELALPGRTLYLRAWQASVGRVPIYLLDSNDQRNDARDRSITSELYGGGPEQRIQQELVLGIGGWNLLQALSLECEVLHLNEGHAAFAVLERARAAMLQEGLSFGAALWRTRAGNLFTTHTPVPAGFDRFEPRLISQYLGDYARALDLELDALLALGRDGSAGADEPFNMALLAMRGSGAVNGVSQLHGEVSRRVFSSLFPHLPVAEVPIGHVTNGVHVPSWESDAADRLWRQVCGEERWQGDLASLESDFRSVTDEALWTLRCDQRRRLVTWLRARHRRQIAARGASPKVMEQQAAILDPDTLTLGFARRFATYKRPNLLLVDPDRLERLLTDANHPVQLVIAGKAHPGDENGRRLIHAWNDFLKRPAVRQRAVFVEDYDIAVARRLVQGVDLWINTPRRPWEASGTSGMKVLVNGGLNFSELDGWWAEAYQPDVGWALGDGNEHDDAPDWDRAEAEALYQMLEGEVRTAFYARDEHGLPQAWLSHMRESMARLTGRFSTNRMVREYTRKFYQPAAEAFRARCAGGAAAAQEALDWLARVQRHWSQVRITSVTREREGERQRLAAQVYLDDLEPDWLCVELYADPDPAGSAPERIPMVRGEALLGTKGAYVYHAENLTTRPEAHFTVRVLPQHPMLRWPLECNLVCWER